jgi:hypothetical protein
MSVSVDRVSSFLESARRKAISHDWDSRLTFRHSALLVDGSKVIAASFNELHTIGLRESVTLAKRSGRYQNENHAEVGAVLRGDRKHDIKGMDVYVVRVVSRGDMALSRPCPLCQKVMREHGIRRAFYSIAEGEFGCMKF